MENHFDNQKLLYFLKQYKRAVLYHISDISLNVKVMTFLNELYRKYEFTALIFGDKERVKMGNWTIHSIVWIASSNVFVFSGYIDSPVVNAPPISKDRSVLKMLTKELVPLVYILTQHERSE